MICFYLGWSGSNQCTHILNRFIQLTQALVCYKLYFHCLRNVNVASSEGTSIAKLTLESLFLFKMSGFCRQRRYGSDDGGSVAAPATTAVSPLGEVARPPYEAYSVF